MTDTTDKPKGKIRSRISLFLSVLYLFTIMMNIVIGLFTRDTWNLAVAALLLLFMQSAALHELRVRPVMSINGLTVNTGSSDDPFDAALKRHFPQP